MNVLTRLLLCLSLAFAPSLHAADIAMAPAPSQASMLAPVETIHLYAGEVKILRMPNVERVAIGNGEIVSVTSLPDQLVVIGTTTGYTNLLIWTTGGALTAFNVEVGNPHPQSVEMLPMVYLTVQVVDFRKSVLSRIGIDWQQAAAGPVLGLVSNVVNNPYFRIGDTQQGGNANNQLRGPQGTINGLPLDIPGAGFVGITTSLSSVINLAVQNGDAYVLASPQLSTRSGGSADFLAGGEVPIPITSALGQVTVQYKEYGIKLKIKPEADQTNNILASIDTEVSQIDPSVTVDSYPGFLTRKTGSIVNVRSGETVVLSGLMQASGAESLSKVPGLGSIPILGRLFSSKDFQANRSELVIFVTPVIVNTASRLNREGIERGVQRMNDFNQGPGEQVFEPGLGAGPGSHLAPAGASPAELEKAAAQSAPEAPPAMTAPVSVIEGQSRPPALPMAVVGPKNMKVVPVVRESRKPAATEPAPVIAPPTPVAAPPAMLVGMEPVAAAPVTVALANTPAAPAASASPITEPSAVYQVQICASLTRAVAESCKARLEKAGFEPGIQAVGEDGKKGFRVRLGPYPNRSSAQQAERLAQSKGFESAFLVKSSVPFEADAASASQP